MLPMDGQALPLKSHQNHTPGSPMHWQAACHSANPKVPTSRTLRRRKLERIPNWKRVFQPHINTPMCPSYRQVHISNLVTCKLATAPKAALLQNVQGTTCVQYRRMTRTKSSPLLIRTHHTYRKSQEAAKPK